MSISLPEGYGMFCVVLCGFTNSLSQKLELLLVLNWFTNM